MESKTRSRCESIPEDFSLMGSAFDNAKTYDQNESVYKNEYDFSSLQPSNKLTIDLNKESSSFDSQIFGNNSFCESLLPNKEYKFSDLVEKINELISERNKHIQRCESIEKRYETLKKKYNESLLSFEKDRQKLIKEKFLYLYTRIKVNNLLPKKYNSNRLNQFKLVNSLLKLKNTLLFEKTKVKDEVNKDFIYFARELEKFKDVFRQKSFTIINKKLNVRIVNTERENRNLKVEQEELVNQIKDKDQIICSLDEKNKTNEVIH